MPDDNVDLPAPTADEVDAAADTTEDTAADAAAADATDDAGKGPTPEEPGADATDAERKAWDDFHAKHPTDEAKGKAYWNAANELARVNREKEALERQLQERQTEEPPPEEPPAEDEVADIEARVDVAQSQEKAVIEEINNLAQEGREIVAKILRLEGRLDGTDSREEEARATLQRQIDDLKREHKTLGTQYKRKIDVDLKQARADLGRAQRDKDRTSKRAERAQKGQEDAATKEKSDVKTLADNTLAWIDQYITDLKIPKDERAECHETVLSRTMRAAYRAAEQGKLLNVEAYVRSQVESFKGYREKVERDVLGRQGQPKGGAANQSKTGGSGGGRPSAPVRDPSAPKPLKHELARESFISGSARK